MEYPLEACFQNRVLAAPDHILAATDLTDSNYLLPHVIAQAKASNGRVTLFHAIAPGDSIPRSATTICGIDDAKVERDARLSLLGMAHEIEPHGIKCQISVRRGYPADAICTEISQAGATRLIMATHGRGRLAQMAIGSVASDLLSWVDIPIFAVGPNAQQPVEHVTPKRILHPVSLAGDFRRSVCLALDVAQTYRAELTLLHVFHPDVRQQINPERAFSWADHALRSFIPPAQDLRVPAQTRVTCGDLVEQVIDTAESIGADWIVVGVDGALPFWRFRDNAAYKIVARSQRPVLTIRHGPCGYREGEAQKNRVERVIG